MTARWRFRVPFLGQRQGLPPAFWFLWLGTIVNRLGGFAVPFLMLYLTSRIQLSVSSAAIIVSALGAGSFAAQLTGGELADRLGRRPVLLLSFFAAPVAMLFVGLVHEPWQLGLGTLLLGFFTDLYRPAMSAAVVDLVPADRRTRAFGYIYWAINLGAAVAPIMAGFLANVDYFLLFLGDAATTAAFGIIVLRWVPESQSREVAAAARERTSARLGVALHDGVLLAFAVLSVLVGIIYSQATVTLPITMAADGLPPSDYGLAIAVNGALVVLVTVWVSRLAEHWHRYRAIALSVLLLGIGFGLTGLADTLGFYALTVVIWTLGEVLGATVAPVIVADLSPPALRGLYQGIWGASYGLAFFLGPTLGGLAFEHLGQGALWTITFVLAVAVALAYLGLSVVAGRRSRQVAR